MGNITDILDGESYGILPFSNTLTAAKIFFAIGGLIILYLIVRAVLYSRSLTLHRAPTSVACAYICASLVNMMLCVLFYWYWALPLCTVISLIFMFTSAGDVKDANSEERTGVWGLNRDIRRIRGELFNDMTPEEQIEYRNSVKEYRFNRPLFVIVTLLIPALFVLACYTSGLGYLFFPV